MAARRGTVGDMTTPTLDRPGIRLVPVAVIVGVCLAIVLSAFAGSGASTVGGRLGGDFPAFYAAGRIVIEGSGDALNDPAMQAVYQEALYPEDDGYLFFAYPRSPRWPTPHSRSSRTVLRSLSPDSLL